MYAVNNAEYYRILEYDRKGNPIKEYLKLLKKTYQHVFINDTLRYTITENLDRGNYPEGEPDADYIDTLFVKKFEKDAGRYLYVQLENKFGLQIEFTITNCRKEVLVVHLKGKKMHDIESIKEDGNVIKTIGVYNEPEKTIEIVNYTDYKFDSQGHWVERTLRFDDGGMTIQKRELEYY
ncbi:MAG: hypothetical protein MK119_08225 [Kordia sp.]|nr:hypothetical protein [Kordia sp.]